MTIHPIHLLIQMTLTKRPRRREEPPKRLSSQHRPNLYRPQYNQSLKPRCNLSNQLLCKHLLTLCLIFFRVCRHKLHNLLDLLNQHSLVSVLFNSPNSHSLNLGLVLCNSLHHQQALGLLAPHQHSRKPQYPSRPNKPSTSSVV